MLIWWGKKHLGVVPMTRHQWMQSSVCDRSCPHKIYLHRRDYLKLEVKTYQGRPSSPRAASPVGPSCWWRRGSRRRRCSRSWRPTRRRGRPSCPGSPASSTGEVRRWRRIFSRFPLSSFSLQRPLLEREKLFLLPQSRRLQNFPRRRLWDNIMDNIMTTKMMMGKNTKS